jgi:hypothetical protein
MKFVKFCFLVTIISFFPVLFSCGADKKSAAPAGFPDAVKNAIKNVPEDVLLGIGTAKTESDGESILLAEDRAREEIARQLSSYITNTRRDFLLEDGTPAEENFTESLTTVTVGGAKVVERVKDKGGNWWCVAWFLNSRLSIPYRVPFRDEIPDIIRSNMAETHDAAGIRADAAIPDWVLRPHFVLPEDAMFGLGAAKLDNDEESIFLAKERARRSLARSLSTEVTSVFYDLTVNGDNEETSYTEINSSVTSKYDHTAIQTQLFNLAKTKDGTWWVLLGCSDDGWKMFSRKLLNADESDKPRASFNAEERTEAAFRKMEEARAGAVDEN